METSSFNYSKIPAPSPQIVSGDGHYLCTVSVKGHKTSLSHYEQELGMGKELQLIDSY